MRSHQALAFAVALGVLAVLPGGASAETPETAGAAPAPAVENGTGGGDVLAPANPPGAGGVEKPLCSRIFRVRAGIMHNAFSDLKVKEARVGRNDLGIAQPDTNVMNAAESIGWNETSEVLELLVDPTGDGDEDAWLFVGIGSRQAESDFYGDNLEINAPPVSLFSAGALGTFGDLEPGVRVDWEARFTYAWSDDRSASWQTAYGEELDYKALTYAVRLTAAFDLKTWDIPSEIDGVGFEPYLGLMYYHLDLDETYTAVSGGGVTKIKYELQSPAGSDVRGIAGLRVLGLDPHAAVSLEGSFGGRVFGFAAMLNLRF